MAKRVSDLTARLDTEVDGTEFVLLSDTDAVYNTITASTISASTVDDSFSDSGNGLGIFRVGTTISVSGFATGSLNTTYTVASVAVDGSKITVEETLTASESAGSSVTIDGLGVSYKMLLSELREYTGDGYVLTSGSDFTAVGISAEYYDNGASGSANRANGEAQKITLTSGGTVITVTGLSTTQRFLLLEIFDADTYAPDISALTPLVNYATVTFGKMTRILAEYCSDNTTRFTYLGYSAT